MQTLSLICDPVLTTVGGFVITVLAGIALESAWPERSQWRAGGMVAAGDVDELNRFAVAQNRAAADAVQCS